MSRAAPRFLSLAARPKPAPAWRGPVATSAPQATSAPALADSSLVQQATERLRAHKRPVSVAAVKRLAQQHELSDEVQLALRLLAPEQLEELLAGEKELQQKLAEVPDKDNLIRKLISMIDPSVDQLVTGLQELEAGNHAASDQERTADIMTEAQRRLAANKSQTSIRAIDKFASHHGLADEVQLAMRMLHSPKLEELLASEEDIGRKLADVDDKNELMLSLISMLDKDVGQLVRSLQELERRSADGQAEPEQDEGTDGQAESERGEGTGAEHCAGEFVAEARRRLAANRTATSTAAIKRFSKDYELSDEVQLALRMLEPSQFEEFLAGEEDLKQKFAEALDRNKMMMSLVAMLDPAVEKLVSGLREREQGQEERAACMQGGDDLVAQAQKRLRANSSPVITTAIKKMTADHDLSDEVQLALRLLAFPQLKKLTTGTRELRQKLEQVSDKNQLMLNLVKMLDPHVGKLVEGLRQLDGQVSHDLWEAKRAFASSSSKKTFTVPPLKVQPLVSKNCEAEGTTQLDGQVSHDLWEAKRAFASSSSKKPITVPPLKVQPLVSKNCEAEGTTFAVAPTKSKAPSFCSTTSKPPPITHAPMSQSPTKKPSPPTTPPPASSLRNKTLRDGGTSHQLDANGWVPKEDDNEDDWGDWQSDHKRYKGACDGAWQGWQDDTWRKSDDTSKGSWNDDRGGVGRTTPSRYQRHTMTGV